MASLTKTSSVRHLFKKTASNDRKTTAVDINVVRIREPAAYYRWKGIVDRILAAILLIPCLPLIMFLILLVRLTSPGPGLFLQCRVGKNGRKYFMYKIRTMIHNAEAETGPVWTQSKDPRVTFVGRFLRKFQLDEIPQLFNVLKGEMSLVGPRPERPEFIKKLSEQIPDYSNRLVVAPGVTGLAQLNLPADSDLNSVRRKLVLDLQYIEQAGLLLDLRLLFCTFFCIFKLPGTVHLFGLRRQVVLPFVPQDHGRIDASQPVLIPGELAQKAAALPSAEAVSGLEISAEKAAKEGKHVPGRSPTPRKTAATVEVDLEEDYRRDDLKNANGMEAA